MTQIKTIDDLVRVLFEDTGSAVSPIGPLHGAGFNDGLGYALKLAEQLRDSMQKDKDHYRWHKVEEELPEKRSLVLIICEDGHQAIAEFNQFFWEPIDSKCHYKNVTHWRYLDAPE